MRNFLKSLLVALFSIQPLTSSFAEQNSSSNDVLIAGSAQPFDIFWKHQFVRDYAELMKALPDPLRITTETVKNVLASNGYPDIDPDNVYYHRFDGAVGSSRTYNGWAHYNTPLESYTLTQAIMLNAFNRFRDYFPGEVDIYTGIYTQGAKAKYFDERNETRLLSSDLWDIAYYQLDIQKTYTQALEEFWLKNQQRFTLLLRDGYALSAFQQYKNGLLNRDQYQLAIELLKAKREKNINVFRFDIYGYDATDILLISRKKENAGLLYIPGAKQPFIIFKNERQLKKYLFQALRKYPINRKTLAQHFSLYIRQDGVSYSGVDSALKGFAENSWNEDYLMMKHRPVFGDVFERVAEQVKMRLISDGDVRIKSNSEAQRDYFISLSSSALTLFPVIDLILPEVGIPLEIGLNVGQFGMSVDKAINGDQIAERLAGSRMSVSNSAVLGAAALVPLLTQYGQALAEATEPNLKLLTNPLIKNGGYPRHNLQHFTVEPKTVIHPRTHETLIGVKIADAGRGALLRPLGFGRYLEIDADTGRALLGKQVTLNLDENTQQFRWNEEQLSPNNEAANLNQKAQKIEESNSETKTESSGFSERLDIILPDDLPNVSPPKSSSSGYEDMAGGRDAEVLRDFAEMEMLVDPYAYLTDVKALHEISINAQKEVMHHPFLMEFQPELTGRLVYRGDTRLPHELFHTGMNRKIAPVKEYQIDANNRGISGVVSTSTEQSIAVDYALGNRMGYVYAIELNHGGKSVNTMLRGADLHEVATLNIPPEDIMFAVGPFNPNAYYSYQVEDSAKRSAELIINPHAVADSEVAEKAFNQIKATLKYQLDPRMTFAERYQNRADLFWHEDETTMPDGTPLD
ncbi:dermonecrotic toxin domain-containing protein [Vibrio azureus]|nr:DUF6543 domain-containing protein [Vibrio azureus]